MKTEIKAQFLSYLQSQQSFHLDLLRQMVEINSFTANAEGVNALGAFTAAAFAKLGFTAESIPSDNPQFGNHLVLTRNGRSSRKIGLVSHLDTVFPADEETKNMIPAASTNVWWITVDNTQFTYNLRRIGAERVFRVVFDLKKTVENPKAPWGWNDD